MMSSGIILANLLGMVRIQERGNPSKPTRIQWNQWNNTGWGPQDSYVALFQWLYGRYNMI